MAIKPVVRYMLLCDDWRFEPANSRRISIIGLISNIHALDDPPYPLEYEAICVFLTLTEGRGSGKCKIVCTFEETGQPIFETHERTLTFGPDPLQVMAVPFRIRDCTFPRAGMYSVQFWYEGELVEERPLRMR